MYCPKCKSESDEFYRDSLVEVWLRDTVIMLSDGAIVPRTNQPQHQQLGQAREQMEVQYVCKTCGHHYPKEDIDRESMERAL